MTPPRRSGKRSNNPSRMNTPRNRRRRVLIAKKSLERMFSPPPRWSVTGRPLLWNARSSRRPPPPTWRTNGMPLALSIDQNGSRSGWVGERSPAAVDGRWIAAQPTVMACSSSITARCGSASGMNPTGSRRGSSLQKSTIAQLWAALPA